MATLAELRLFAEDIFFDSSDVKSRRLTDRSINGGMRLLAQSYEWPHYNTIGRINTVPQQSSGTVAITQAASTAVLTSATWPTDLTDYYIRIDSDYTDYYFSARVGDNTGTFATGQVYNGDTATADTYILYKERYSLPSDCRQFGRLSSEYLDWGLNYKSREDYLTIKLRDIKNSGDPQIVSHDDSYAYFWPPPDERKAVSFTYQRWPATMTASTDVADWPDSQIDILYGVIGIQMQMNDHKLSWQEGLVQAKQFCWHFADQAQLRNAPEVVQPFAIGSCGPCNPMDYSDA